jgi:hypothetical protein
LAYEAISGIDLVKECIINLSTQIADIMGISTGLKRMDSMMVASNIKKLSRLELLYTCVSNLVKYLHKNGDDIPAEMQHYCEADDCNKVIYHMKSMNIGEKVDRVLQDASLLIKKCASNYDQNNEYQLLIRVIGEQTIKGDNDSLILKDKKDKTMDSTILQNPADPDATYRFKAGKDYRGYTANLTEDVDRDKKISIISGYDYQTNTYSDSQFLKDSIASSVKQKKTVTLVAYGAYGGEANIAKAKEKNINLVTTNFQATKPASILANF